MLAPFRPVSLTVQLFGPMQVLVDGQPLPPLRTRKTLSLLALLTLRHDRPVEREWLAGVLWPEMEQTPALGRLRVVLSELRKALGMEGVRLESPNRRTLVLNLRHGTVDVDVLTFDAAIRSGDTAALERAVSLYRGPLLEGHMEEWAEQERTAREQDCLRALQTLAETARKARNDTATVDYWRRAVNLDPLWEVARRGCMEALAQTGDTNAALHIYREFVALLRNDPKAVPNAQTTALYQRLRDETKQRATTPVANAPTPTVGGYLPHALTDLIGREDECQEVAERLQRSRLVTLTGPGGIGKTRLALAVASEVVREYPDGIWLVALESLNEPWMVVPQIASVLGLPEEAGRTPRETVTKYLQDKRLLLVLDNCEHLVDACAEALSPLLRHCPGLRILATSREALAIAGETVWSVPPLAVPNPAQLPRSSANLQRVLMGYEGVQLFVERAQAVQNGFAPTGRNALAVAQVCARLEGIPLALELAASRVRAMTVVQMAERLDDHLGLLIGGSRTALSRQRTLRGTLDWSYTLLTEPEQRLLGRLSVFAGGWTLSAAESVCSGENIEAWQVLDLLARLVDKSLVVFSAESYKGTEARYRLLEMVRQYAAERLAQSGEGETIRARHRAWLEALAAEVRGKWRDAEAAKYKRLLRAEYDNLRATLDWKGAVIADPEADLRLVERLWTLWSDLGLHREGRDYTERALAAETGDTKLRALAREALAHLCSGQGDFDAARTALQESLRISRAFGDKAGIAGSLHGLSTVAMRQGDLSTAITLLEECLSLSREMGSVRGIAFALGNLGNVHNVQGNYVTARAMYEECLAVRRGLGDTEGIANVLGNLGVVAGAQGKWAEAQAFVEENLHLYRELGNQGGIALALSNLGDIALTQGEQERAETLLEEAHGLFVEAGDRWGIAATLETLGTAAYQRGDYAAAHSRLCEGLRIRREMGNREGMAKSLEELAAVALAQSAPEKAARLLGAAHALRESIGTPLRAHEQEAYHRQVEKTRSALSEDGFTSAWNTGLGMTWEEAVAYALGEFLA